MIADVTDDDQVTVSKADIGEILASSMEPGTPAWERLYQVMTGEGFCDITEEDLGRTTVDASRHRWLVFGITGQTRVLKVDIGKRRYKVGDALRAESDAQHAHRRLMGMRPDAEQIPGQDAGIKQ